MKLKKFKKYQVGSKIPKENHPEKDDQLLPPPFNRLEKVTPVWKKAIAFLLQSLKENSLEIINERCKKLFGMTPLTVLSSVGHLDGVKNLIEAGADVNERNTSDGNTPLMTAIQGQFVNVATMLLAHGASVSVQNNDGMSPLMIAVKTLDFSVLNLLRKYCTNINHANSSGATAIHLAAKRGWKECVQFLLDNGASVNICDSLGQTPLMMAASAGDMKTVEFLRSKSCVLQEDYYGNTAICKAIQWEKDKVFNYLLDRLSVEEAEQYIKSRVELLRYPAVQASDVDKYYEDILLPTFLEFDNKPEYQELLLRHKVIASILGIDQKYIANCEIVSYVCVLCARIFVQNVGDIKERHVNQFTQAKGPEFVLEAMERHQDHRVNGDTVCAIASFMPVLTLGQSDPSRSWVERNFAKLLPFVQFYREQAHCVSCLFERPHMKARVADMWRQFVDFFDSLHLRHREQNIADLLKSETREKERREKKREKKRQKRQRDQRLKTQNIANLSKYVNSTVKDLELAKKEYLQSSSAQPVGPSHTSRADLKMHKAKSAAGKFAASAGVSSDGPDSLGLKGIYLSHMQDNLYSFGALSNRKKPSIHAENSASAPQWVKVEAKKSNAKAKKKERFTKTQNAQNLNSKMVSNRPSLLNKGRTDARSPAKVGSMSWADIARADTKSNPEMPLKRTAVPAKLHETKQYDFEFPCLSSSMQEKVPPIPAFVLDSKSCESLGSSVDVPEEEAQRCGDVVVCCDWWNCVAPDPAPNQGKRSAAEAGASPAQADPAELSAGADRGSAKSSEDRKGKQLTAEAAHASKSVPFYMPSIHDGTDDRLEFELANAEGKLEDSSIIVTGPVSDRASFRDSDYPNYLLNIPLPHLDQIPKMKSRLLKIIQRNYEEGKAGRGNDPPGHPQQPAAESGEGKTMEPDSAKNGDRRPKSEIKTANYRKTHNLPYASVQPMVRSSERMEPIKMTSSGCLGYTVSSQETQPSLAHKQVSLRYREANSNTCDNGLLRHSHLPDPACSSHLGTGYKHEQSFKPSLIINTGTHFPNQKDSGADKHGFHPGVISPLSSDLRRGRPPKPSRATVNSDYPLDNVRIQQVKRYLEKSDLNSVFGHDAFYYLSCLGGKVSQDLAREFSIVCPQILPCLATPSNLETILNNIHNGHAPCVYREHGSTAGLSTAEQNKLLQEITLTMFKFKSASPIKSWVPKSKRWRSYLEQINSAAACMRRQINNIILPLNLSDYILNPNGHPTVLGFLQDGTEVAVKIFCVSECSGIASELMKLIHPTFEQYFLLKFKAIAVMKKFLLLAMDLCEYTLSEYMELLKSDQMFDRITASRLVWQMLRGLKFLHNSNILHGRLKPQNILIEESGKLLLTDYGMRHPYDQIQKELCATSLPLVSARCWRPYEVLASGDENNYTFQSDIQIAGMLAHYIMTGGKHPFGKNVYEIESNILQNWNKLKHVGEEANDLIRGMLTYLPSLRPTVDEVLGHPYFWADEKRFRFVLISGSDVLRDMKAGAGLIGTDGTTMIDILNNTAYLSSGGDWASIIDESLMKEMRPFRQYKNTLAELVLFIYNTCLHFDTMSLEVRDFLDDPCKYFMSKFPGVFMAVYHAIKQSDRKIRPCYQPFY